MPSHAMSIDNLCIADVQDDYSRHPNWATPEDWDAHQETIRRLYLDEKRPLKDVVVIMESEYGFRATPSPHDLKFHMRETKDGWCQNVQDQACQVEDVEKPTSWKWPLK
ncbi:hypothetical protein HD806DRAFT_531619 [Xylariaceae sp. AK1471]|nr:hypothetical protein HD806DRAFT_531619 [Xylariaceae sp. AK1471]